MRRQCGRTGCVRAAAATMSFVPGEAVVSLDTLRDDGQSAGDLCSLHADRLVPPAGWRVDDRRVARPSRVATLAQLAVPAPAPVAAPLPVPVAAAEQGTLPRGQSEWSPRFGVDDLNGLLHAETPLLSRAFRAAKAF